MRSRILVGLVAGAIGGFLGWLMQETLVPHQAVRNVLTGECQVIDLTGAQTRTLIFCVGGLIGLFLSVVDGLVEGNSRKLVQGMVFGTLAGIVLGAVGFTIGGTVYGALGGSDNMPKNPSLFAFLQQVIARSFGWALMGVGIGVGASLATRSPKRIGHGAIGGFLGGFAGGFVFDLIAPVLSPVQTALAAADCREAGGPSRLVGFTAIGALTGFFIGLVGEMFKQAWVKVLAGRNEGKDFILAKAMNLLGRDERCDVPLYGDPTIGIQHAAIRAEGNRHILMDGNTPTGTVVNGQRVPTGGELMLRDGDMIQIGSQRILFREKATANKYARAPIDEPKSKSPVAATPMPSHLCPFCGAPKDASGGCLCTVAGSSAASVGTANAGAAPPVYTPGPSVGAGVLGSGMSQLGTAYGGYGQPALSGLAPGGMSSMPRLVGTEGPYAGQVFLLTEPNIAIGREPARDIALSADTTISRDHARIANEGGSYVVYDNGSSNGTFVNGMRVSMQALTPGDIVQFGSSKFRYE